MEDLRPPEARDRVRRDFPAARLEFTKDEAFDAAIRDRFEEIIHLAAARGELTPWGETDEGALALVLLTDQFPRQLYGAARPMRSLHRSLARATARDAIHAGSPPGDGAEPARVLLPAVPAPRRTRPTSEFGLNLAEALEADGGAASAGRATHRDVVEPSAASPTGAVLGRRNTPDETGPSWKRADSGVMRDRSKSA